MLYEFNLISNIIKHSAMRYKNFLHLSFRSFGQLLETMNNRCVRVDDLKMVSITNIEPATVLIGLSYIKFDTKYNK